MIRSTPGPLETKQTQAEPGEVEAVPKEQFLVHWSCPGPAQAAQGSGKVPIPGGVSQTCQGGAEG